MAALSHWEPRNFGGGMLAADLDIAVDVSAAVAAGDRNMLGGDCEVAHSTSSNF
jgi:hypothetical protein